MLTTELKKRIENIYSNKYQYIFTTNNINTNDKIQAICPLHGTFLTRVHDHLYNDSGCPTCGRLRVLLNFKDIAKNKFGNKYDYSKVNYVNCYTPVEIICNIHGSFYQEPTVHLLSKIGCQQCRIHARTNTLPLFIEKAHNIHNNKYDYSKVKYTNCKHKVEIICSIHGSFHQTPDNHTSKRAGCPKCAGNTLRGKYVAGYSKINKPGFLYIMKFWDNTEEFIKIGITIRQRINYRYGVHHCGYNVKCLHKFDLPISIANKIEIKLLDNLSDFKYSPIRHFGGYTECLKIQAPIVYDETIRLIGQTGSTEDTIL